MSHRDQPTPKLIERLVCRGSLEISLAVGVPVREVPRYVEEFGLPAFKFPGTKRWIALPGDLKEWVQEQRDELMADTGE